MKTQNAMEQSIHPMNKGNISDKSLAERFEFRNIRADETQQAAAIEQICFPPNEANSFEEIHNRAMKAPELFLVAVDKETGKLAGFLSGLSTDEEVFRDEFFMDAELYEPQGSNVMILSLDVLPKYRGQGLARELMNRYKERERKNHRRMLVLTCLNGKVGMYQRMDFTDKGISGSVWGGEEWHEMSCVIEE